MGVFDDLKKSVSGNSSNQSSSKRGRTGADSSKPKGGLDSDSFSNDFDLGDSSSSQSIGNSNSQSPGGNQSSINQQNAGRQQGGQRNSRGRSSQRGGSNTGSGGRNYPNAQAGRPQQGSDSPQLSQSTKRKMENAGMNPDQNRGQASSQDGSVAGSRDDFEDLKAQNQQIIELLKRINQNLQGR